MVIDAGCTFRQVIVGKSNQRAVERTKRSHSMVPVLLLGPSGVGKSHLLHAVANRLSARGRRVLAVRAHEFREQYVACICAGTFDEQRRWMRRHMATLKLWPVLLDLLARWDADILPIRAPSLAQRSVAVARRARRSMPRSRLVEIARATATIPAACAALERELLASETGVASTARV